MDAAGRWSRVGGQPQAEPERAPDETIERTLLRRWGVLFWRLLAREAQWLPPWRELLMCCRRLEARGEIRGGRFIAGFSGEQYAAPEAIALLREARRKPNEGHHVAVCGADPLNLVGILTPGARLPSLIGNRALYRDGVPIALLSGGEVSFLLSARSSGGAQPGAAPPRAAALADRPEWCVRRVRASHTPLSSSCERPATSLPAAMVFSHACRDHRRVGIDDLPWAITGVRSA
jgi:hypothetical protein